jgi:hypothetical protein
VNKLTDKEKTVEKITFSKAQLLASERYKNRRDLLGALLEESKEYAFKDVDSAIEKFLKGVNS